MEPLPKNQYLRAVALKERVRKFSRNNEEGPRYAADQPEPLDIEELTGQLVKEITGANAWELSEDEFTELGASQNRYACFITITAQWHKLIIEGINLGEAKTFNPEGLETIAWRGVKEINKAYYAKFGVYLWEPGTGITEGGDQTEDEEEPEDEGEGSTLPQCHDIEGQQLLF